MNEKNQKLVRIILILIISLLIQLCFTKFSNLLRQTFFILLPILLGFTIAFVLPPIVKFLGKKLSYKISVVIAFISFILIVIGIVCILLPVIFKESILFFEQLPDIIENLKNNITENKKIKFFKFFRKINKDFDLEQYLNQKILMIEEVGIKIIRSIFSTLLIFVLTIVISAYILMDFDNIISWLKCKTTEFKFSKIRICLIRMKDLMYSYFSGVLIVFIMMFISSSVLFKVIGLNYSVVLGLIFAISNLIPYLGPYIGGLFAIVSGIAISIKTAIFAFIIVVLLQLLENYFLTPKIQSKKLNIKPFFLLITVVIMGKILGVIGMLISIPVLSLFQTIFDVFILKKEDFNIVKISK